MKVKHKYSRKVRAIGYGVVAVEVLAIALWVVAWYSTAMTFVGTASPLTSSSSGSLGPLGALDSYVRNETTPTGTEVVVSLPVEGGGYVPVTISVDLMVTASQTSVPIQGTITVSPGQTENLTVIANVSSGVSLSGASVSGSAHVSSLDGLVGFSVMLTNISGNTTSTSSTQGGTP